MEPSPDNQLSAVQTLDPATNPPAEIPQSDPQLTDDANPVGEKRKRDQDEEAEGEQSANQTVSSDSTLHPLWKTSLCSYFRRNSGSCSHGSSCRYAHGEEELRLRPDNTWDPTSERARKARKTENSANCEAGGEEEDEVLMTEMVDDDGDGGGGGDNSECVLDPGFSKCLVHLPRKWDSDQLRKFLKEQVRDLSVFSVFYLLFFLVAFLFHVILVLVILKMMMEEIMYINTLSCINYACTCIISVKSLCEKLIT